MTRYYMCIDLKSFYASVECVERGLNPLDTNLVVADDSRTEKTICLAVSPSLKQYGINGRSRLYEVIQRVKELNKEKLKNNNYKKLNGKSCIDSELKKDKNLEIDYIVATPRMRKYMQYSTDIYNVYLKYLSPEDILVYSIDEVFCDITNYLKLYKSTPIELASKIIKSVLEKTGITATAGIGTNMYLAKVAMDIVAKHSEPDINGVRIAQIDEMDYRRKLWNHKPLTSFWRVGRGISKKLEEHGMYTMGDVARCSIENENLLYKLFGVNAELLIDHAWGYEPITIKEAKSYTPTMNSLSTSQVLPEPYDYKKTKLVVTEMIDLMALELSKKKLVTNQLILTIGYDIENLSNNKNKNLELEKDFYGRSVPKHSRGTINIGFKTSSSKVLTKKILESFEKIIKKDLLVRRINLTASNVVNEKEIDKDIVFDQMNLFSNYDETSLDKKLKSEQKDEINLQRTIVNIKEKYGKNSILKVMNLEEGGTTINRNKQVGGHRG